MEKVRYPIKHGSFVVCSFMHFLLNVSFLLHTSNICCLMENLYQGG